MGESSATIIAATEDESLSPVQEAMRAVDRQE